MGVKEVRLIIGEYQVVLQAMVHQLEMLVVAEMVQVAVAVAVQTLLALQAAMVAVAFQAAAVDNQTVAVQHKLAATVVQV
jgi:hypothetical protein